MFTSLVQRTKKIIQEKYLRVETGTVATVAVAAADSHERLDEKSQEMKDHIYGECYQFGKFFVFLLKVFSLLPSDLIRTIKDPEKPATLEDLDVVYENGVKVSLLKRLLAAHFPLLELL